MKNITLIATVLVSFVSTSNYTIAASCSQDLPVNPENPNVTYNFILTDDHALTTASSVSHAVVSWIDRTGTLVLREDTSSVPSNITAKPIQFSITGARFYSPYCKGSYCAIPAGIELHNRPIYLGQIPTDATVPITFSLSSPGTCSGSLRVINPYICKTIISPSSITVKMAATDALDLPVTITTSCNKTPSKLTMTARGDIQPLFPATLTLSSAGADTSIIPGSILMSCSNSSTCSKTVNVNIKSGATVGRGKAVLYIDTYSG